MLARDKVRIMNALNNTEAFGKNGTEIAIVLKRMEVKVENLRLEFKATGNPRKYEMDELLSLIETLKSNLLFKKGGRA